MSLPNDVEPRHHSLQNGLPSDVAPHQRRDDRGGGQNENDHAQDATLQGFDAEQAEDTGEEHDETRGHRNDGGEGCKGREIQSGQTADERQGSANTPDDIHNADDDVNESFHRKTSEYMMIVWIF